MTKEMLWLLMGHLVCIGQWAAFIMVEYAFLGRGQEIPLPLPVGSPAGSSISSGLDPA